MEEAELALLNWQTEQALRMLTVLANKLTISLNELADSLEEEARGLNQNKEWKAQEKTEPA